jgi:hypothetical protein
MRSGLVKVGAILLAVLVMLALAGVGYGIWTDQIEISGTIEAGTVSAEIDGYVCMADPISCNIITSTLPNDTLQITLTGATADTEYRVWFILKNIGSIPVNINSIQVIPSLPPPNISVRVEDLGGGSLVGVQLEQSGTDSTADGYVYVTPDTDDTTTFQVKFEFVPWNKYVP